jgi:signal transduction histidine kinase
VTVHAVPAERLPAPVEASAYFLVAEALTNAARHARATRIDVTLRREEGVLRVEVADDGDGGARAEGGSGLRGLADRLAALEGTLEVVSPPGGGTLVRGCVPCAP